MKLRFLGLGGLVCAVKFVDLPLCQFSPTFFFWNDLESKPSANISFYVDLKPRISCCDGSSYFYLDQSYHGIRALVLGLMYVANAFSHQALVLIKIWNYFRIGGQFLIPFKPRMMRDKAIRNMDQGVTKVLCRIPPIARLN